MGAMTGNKHYISLKGMCQVASWLKQPCLLTMCGSAGYVAPCLMIGGPPPEQLVFLINTAATPKFAAQLKSYGPLESI